MEGFIYPNEAEVAWSVNIVIYTYITGLVAGAFVISSLYHVFGIRSLRPVARFSLIASLAFLMVAPLPLLFHAGHPERAAVNMLFTPNLTSAMAAFGFIWFGYLVLVIAEVLLVFRRDMVSYAKSSKGVLRWLYLALLLGIENPSEESFAANERVIRVLALLGIPGAMVLHGYVGFIFGAVKAMAWWSTPLMPVIFLLSAIVSGIALIMVLYTLLSILRGKGVDHPTVISLSRWLLGFLALDLTLEALEVVSMAYEGEESWEMISQLITRVIPVSYLGIQLGMGTLLPLVVLGVMAARGLKGRLSSTLASLSGFLVLVGVLAMRWNVIIGGQLLSKSLRGFTSYIPPLLGMEGLLISAVLLALPFAILGVSLYLLPPWLVEVAPEEERPAFRAIPGVRRGGLARQGVRFGR
ncbi:MAG: Polysulfide reductase NrfD [Dehalococcoidia bacterium]|nr:Polysulfide reductase NrfD [Dehalococcoidia bacterium]